MNVTAGHAAALSAELDWLDTLIDRRLERHFKGTGPGEAPAPPDHAPKASALGAAIHAHGLDAADRAVLALALAPHLRPHALDPFQLRNPNIDRPFTEFGDGRGDPGEAGFRPSFQTAAFLLAGDRLSARLDFERRYLGRAPLLASRLIGRPVAPHGLFAAPLRPTPHALARLCHGRPHRPDLTPEFPARRLDTALEWDDLVLPRATRAALDDLLNWLRHAPRLAADPHFGRLVQPGYRALFAGPSGTGKTLTATLIGKATGREVYRVDLSLVVSKWIGETEKNLATLFDQAEGAGWILFFDEADALFGQRSEVSQAHDRYANQEVAYMLQRIETLDGLVILASNLAANIDEAFSRRFQSVIPFPAPGPPQRQRLWEKALPEPEARAADIDTRALAERYALTGGAIVNVLMLAALSAHADGGRPLALGDIERAVARELWKDGRVGERDA